MFAPDTFWPQNLMKDHHPNKTQSNTFELRFDSIQSAKTRFMWFSVWVNQGWRASCGHWTMAHQPCEQALYCLILKQQTCFFSPALWIATLSVRCAIVSSHAADAEEPLLKQNNRSSSQVDGWLERTVVSLSLTSQSLTSPLCEQQFSQVLCRYFRQLVVFFFPFQRPPVWQVYQFSATT